MSRTFLTIGMFDGVHVGHQHLLYQLNNFAVAQNVPSIAITFSQHPLEVITKNPPALIMPLAKKLNILQSLSISVCLVLDFTKDVSCIPALEFLEILVTKCGMTGIVIGSDFRFGHEGHGNYDMLQHYAPTYCYQIHVVDIQHRVHGKVSSTRIRDAITHGDIHAANAMLGRAFSIIGRVIHGQQMGRILGFPTANLELLHGLCPAQGVYAGETILQNVTYPSLVSIGTCPTFGQKELKIEVYLSGYNGNLYGQTIETYIVEKIRDQKRFSSAEELCTQMELDRRYIENIHTHHTSIIP